MTLFHHHRAWLVMMEKEAIFTYEQNHFGKGEINRKAPMIIAQISDTHICQGLAVSQMRLEGLYQTVKSINALDPQPDVIIHTGDMVHGGELEDYWRVKEILSQLKAPFFPVPGNQDDREHMAHAFDLKLQEGFIQYSVDGFPVRLVGIDTTTPDSKMGKFCNNRLNLLRKALAQEGEKSTALFMHHPPFAVETSKYPHQYDDWGDCDNLAELLIEQDQVAHLFCGHSHRNYVTDVRGIPATTLPSLSVDLRMGDFPEHQLKSPLFQIHKWDGGKFVSETVAVVN
ncbi:MAG: metallophosphoesterase [Rhodospirillales bacterium]|nr:metallophosphoesterase [Rhodospirillales bacterium]